jgi:hypothetical protein
MNTTVKSALPGFLLFLAQAPIAWAVSVAGSAARQHWIELIPGKPLPLLSEWALEFPIAIPATAALLSLILLGVDWRRKSPGYFLLFTISTCEAVALALFAMALTLPALSINYGLKA